MKNIMNTQKYCYFVTRKLLRIAQKNFVNTSNQIFQSVKQHRKKKYCIILSVKYYYI